MPIFGVIKLTFERDGGSMRGEDDFFSVASTMPLVAVQKLDLCVQFLALCELALDAQRGYTLVDGVQCIFCKN